MIVERAAKEQLALGAVLREPQLDKSLAREFFVQLKENSLGPTGDGAEFVFQLLARSAGFCGGGRAERRPLKFPFIS